MNPRERTAVALTAFDPSALTTRPRRSRLCRALRVVTVTAVMLLAVGQIIDFATARPGVGYWRSAEDRARYVTAYDDAMADLPTPDAVLDVPTAYGTVRVIRWGPDDGSIPVLLLPGRGSGIPMWGENLPGLIDGRTVYALDAVGDAGMSTQSVPLSDPKGQADWIAEALHGLGIERAHIVGHSFGGASAALLAVHHPKVVASLALIEPIMVIEGMPASIYLWSAVLMLPGPQSWKDRALAEIGGTSVADVQARTPISRMIDAGTTGYSAQLPMPMTLTDEQWQELDMPVRVDLGGHSELAGGQRSADRISSLLQEAEVTVWPGGTHSLPMNEHERIDAQLLGFWDEVE